MKMYKDDKKENIPPDKPAKINLEEALKEVDNLPVVEGSFIGFTNERDEAIQFVRFEENEWLIDIPVLENETYVYSLQDYVKHSQVREIVTRFFEDKEWKNLVHLRRV